VLRRRRPLLQDFGPSFFHLVLVLILVLLLVGRLALFCVLLKDPELARGEGFSLSSVSLTSHSHACDPAPQKIYESSPIVGIIIGNSLTMLILHLRFRQLAWCGVVVRAATRAPPRSPASLQARRNFLPTYNAGSSKQMPDKAKSLRLDYENVQNVPARSSQRVHRPPSAGHTNHSFSHAKDSAILAGRRSICIYGGFFLCGRAHAKWQQRSTGLWLQRRTGHPLASFLAAIVCPRRVRTVVACPAAQPPQ
jgi:hypothetical protein